MSWAHYLIQVNIYLVIFYCFYQLLLAKETYFILNRVYLVLSGLLSLAIPFMRIELFSEKAVSDQLYVSVSELNNMVSNYAVLPQTQEQYDWGRLVVIIYLIGTFLFLLYFAYQLLIINLLFGKAKNDDAFSFFSRKFVATDLPERETVDLHEDIHIKQMHSADVIFFEILGIITWFNPIIYCYKKSIKNIHEYLADDVAASLQGDKEKYSLLLLSHAFGVKPNNLINGFNTKSLIKKRIYMLHKKRSKKTAFLKYGMSVPLLALTLILSSATIRKNNQILSVATQIPLNEAPGLVEKVMKAPLSIANLVAPPPPIENQIVTPSSPAVNINIPIIIPEKEKSTSWTGLYTYLANNIRYPADAVSIKLQGVVFVNFSINKGRIMEIYAQNELGAGCEEEVINGIETFGDYFGRDGKYTIKVIFKLDGLNSELKNGNSKSIDDFEQLHNITITAFLPKEQPADETVYNYVTVSTQPSYPGGMAEFYKFLGKTINYPSIASDNEVQGNVFVSFTVEKDGSLTSIRVDRKLGYGTDEEAVRVLKLAKRWNPGMQNGKPVRVQYNLPIKFVLDNNAQAKTSFNLSAKRFTESKNSPLIVVDNESKDFSVFKQIDAETIAAVNILKGENATRIYGKSAEHGAILITTKKPFIITTNN